MSVGTSTLINAFTDPALSANMARIENLCYSVGKGNLGSIDAGAGTQAIPIVCPASTKSGFWIITVAGYVNLGGVSTAFDTNDLLVYDLTSNSYSRLDTKNADVNIDLSSNFTNSLALVAPNQKAVNERLDLITAPAGAAGISGALTYWDGTKRINIDTDAIKWIANNKQLLFGNDASIKIGEHTITRLSSNFLQTNNSLLIGGYFQSSLLAYMGAGIALEMGFGIKGANKANTAYLSFITRNSTGSETVYDLTSVGNITMPFASQISTLAGALQFNTKLGNAIQFLLTDSIRWQIQPNLIPYTDNVVDIGSISFRVKDGHFAGALYSGSLDSSGYIWSGSSLTAGTDLRVMGSFSIRNKANNNWLSFGTRDVSGSETVYHLNNIGNITPGDGQRNLGSAVCPWALLAIKTGSYIDWGDGNARIRESGHGLDFLTYNASDGIPVRWTITTDGTLKGAMNGQKIQLKSPDGTYYNISVTNVGTLVVVAV